jgi:hypothetical protein
VATEAAVAGSESAAIAVVAFMGATFFSNSI